MRLRTLILVMFSLWSAESLFSQAPAAPATAPAQPHVSQTPAAPATAAPSQPQAGASSSVEQESVPPLVPGTPPNVPVFQFHFRAAFMLTPAMVAAIQSTSLNARKSNSNSSSGKDSSPAWKDPILREVSLASPLGIKIQGEQLVAIIVFMPVELVKKSLTMLVQSQIYARSPDDSIQMNTSVHTIRVPLGTLFYYYPLGGDSKQGAPVAIEILVDQK